MDSVPVEEAGSKQWVLNDRDVEWSICWDFENKSWGSKDGGSRQGAESWETGPRLPLPESRPPWMWSPGSSPMAAEGPYAGDASEAFAPWLSMWSSASPGGRGHSVGWEQDWGMGPSVDAGPYQAPEQSPGLPLENIRRPSVQEAPPAPGAWEFAPPGIREDPQASGAEEDQQVGGHLEPSRAAEEILQLVGRGTEAAASSGKPSRRQKDAAKEGKGAGAEARSNVAPAQAKDEVNAEIEAILSEPGTPLQAVDFDSGVRRYLTAIRLGGNRQRVKDAMAMIQTYTGPKSRETVKNWSAYLLTLLKRFAPGLMDKGKGKGHAAGREGGGSFSDNTNSRHGSFLAGPDGGEDPALAAARAVQLLAAAKAAAAAKKKAEKKDRNAAKEAKELEGQLQPLPEGWQERRRPFTEELQQALGSKGLLCPFTKTRLNVQDALVAPAALSLTAEEGPAATLRRHLVGVAGSLAFSDCSLTSSSAPAAESLLRHVPEDPSVNDILEAIKPAKGPKASALRQEVTLELLVEVLRTPQLGPAS